MHYVLEVLRNSILKPIARAQASLQLQPVTSACIYLCCATRILHWIATSPKELTPVQHVLRWLDNKRKSKRSPFWKRKHYNGFIKNLRRIFDGDPVQKFSDCQAEADVDRAGGKEFTALASKTLTWIQLLHSPHKHPAALLPRHTGLLLSVALKH